MIKNFKKKNYDAHKHTFRSNDLVSEKLVETDTHSIDNTSSESVKSERPIPAITFGTGIYAVNTSYSIPDDMNVYTTMLDVDRDIINNQMTLYEQNKNISNLQVETIDQAYWHMFEITSSNFETSIDNCIVVHLANLNRLFEVDGVLTINFLEYDLNNNKNAPWLSYSPRLIRYEKTYDEIINNILNGTLVDRIQLYINELGNTVYTYIRKRLNKLFAQIMTEDQNTIITIMDQVNTEFSRLMQDLCYEGCIYVYNLNIVVNSSPVAPEQIEMIRKDSHYLEEPFQNIM